MGEIVKFITEKLNGPPFNRNFNFITFDGLEAGLLLQILSDVLGELDVKHKMDIREEAPEQTTMRILETLRIFRYPVPVEADALTKFCEGLVVGDTFFIYPILEWLLTNFDDLKKRAYLAKYLMKVRIPPEFLQDQEISKLFSEHSALIETFKEAHKRFEALKTDGMSTSDIKKDITAMQEEKEQILRRISRMKKKLEMFPTSTAMLDMARKLRLEREKEVKAAKQIFEQRSLIQNLEQRIAELRQQSNEIRRRATDCTADSLLNRLEEEVKVNQYLATDKQPKEIEMTKMYVEDLSRVTNQPAMTHGFLDQLNQKLREVHSETNRLVEKRMVAADPLEDKASLFRQQASIATNRKESTATALAEAREKQISVSKELVELRAKLTKTIEDAGITDSNPAANSNLCGEESPLAAIRIPKAEEFQTYVNSLRTKNLTYKQKRAALSSLRAEKGILNRTLDILKGVEKQAKRKLDAAEVSHGMSGYWDTMAKLEKVSEETANLNQRKGSALEEMSSMVARLNQHILARRDKLAPLIRELRPLRIKSQELTQLHSESKSEFDAFVTSRDAQTLCLEQEVRILGEEVRVEESRFHYLNAAISLLKVQQYRLQEEMRGYLTSTGAATGDGTTTGVHTHSITVKRRSYRDLYLRKITEQESLTNVLKEEQKHLDANQTQNMNQMRLWKDLVVILECKLDCRLAADEKIAAGGDYADVQQIEKDRLLL